MPIPNITAKDCYTKLRDLEIPSLESKALINASYSFMGRFAGADYSLYWALIDAKKEKLTGLEALSKIEKDISIFYMKVFK